MFGFRYVFGCRIAAGTRNRARIMAADSGAAPLSHSRLHYLWPLALAALIFAASSRSQVAAPQVTLIDDKIVHFAVYGLLATLVCRLGNGRRAAVWSLVLVSAYGASDEWHQSYVPGRSMELMDWIADTLGASVAIALYVGWPRYRDWLERPLGRGRRAVLPATALAERSVS